jgi:hypothetical protein
VSWSSQGPPGITTYTIQVFQSAASGANGQFLVQTFTVTTNGAGSASGSFSVSGLAPGQFITATATEGDAGSTSDFSNSVQL